MEGCVGVDAEFGQCVPRREYKNKVKGRCIVRFWKETLQARNRALPGRISYINSGPEARALTHLKQVFKVVPGKSFHFGDVVIEPPDCLTKHRNLSKAYWIKGQKMDIPRYRMAGLLTVH